MKHLVGTLVRYGNGGQFEPYLAEKFSFDPDRRLWKFKLRHGLTCENGEPITASGFVSGFQNQARRYSNNGPIPILSDLKGWKNLVAGGTIPGIRVGAENEVILEFEKSVSLGLLEYLSMPYYGYFCAANFVKGDWAKNDRIISSGPYSIDSVSADRKEVSLKIRREWPLAGKGAPNEVHYYGSIPPKVWDSNARVIQKHIGWNEIEPKGFRKIHSPPDIVRSIVLDPEGGSKYFSSLEARKVFQAKVYDLQKTLPFLSKSAVIGNAFYASANHKLPEVAITSKKLNPVRKLKIFIPSTETDESKYLLKLATMTLEALGWPFEVLSPETDSALKAVDTTSKTKFDIRLTSVVAGSVMEPWVVEMMFCSNMGVSFVDPSGKVCSTARKILSNPASYNVSQEGTTISQIIHEDAAVIPVYHGRTTWYFSEDLDVSQIAGDLILPSFEDIRIKE